VPGLPNSIPAVALLAFFSFKALIFGQWLQVCHSVEYRSGTFAVAVRMQHLVSRTHASGKTALKLLPRWAFMYEV
jgi:hypothetical protein